MKKGIRDYLKKIVLDTEFRSLVDSDMKKSFIDFDLTEEEKVQLSSRTEDISSLVAKAINDIASEIVDNWDSHGINSTTTNQSAQVRPIIVIYPPIPDPPTFPPLPPQPRPRGPFPVPGPRGPFPIPGPRGPFPIPGPRGPFPVPPRPSTPPTPNPPPPNPPSPSPPSPSPSPNPPSPEPRPPREPIPRPWPEPPAPEPPAPEPPAPEPPAPEPPAPEPPAPEPPAPLPPIILARVGGDQNSNELEDFQISDIVNLSDLDLEKITRYYANTEALRPSFNEPAIELPNYDIYIVGLGIKNIDHVTRETEYVLNKAKKIFYIENGIGVQEYLEGFCEDVSNLVSEYNTDDDRMNTYIKMSMKVTKAAIKASGPIVLALYGHPTIYAMPPFLIKNVANKLGLSVKVLPGISSMDSIFADFMIDPSTDGLQMYEATEMLLKERPLINDVPALIWQVGTIETALYSAKTSSKQRFIGLINYLLNFYSPNHKVYFLFASNFYLMPSSQFSCKISEIGESSEKIHGGHTMFIPPASTRDIMNMELAMKLNSVKHLKSITNK